MTELETTMKGLAGNWQGILNAMAEGRSDEERGLLVETMMLVAQANHGQLFGPSTTAASLEATARMLRRADKQGRAARERPPADVIRMKSRMG